MNMWGTPAEDSENAETESRETAETQMTQIERRMDHAKFIHLARHLYRGRSDRIFLRSGHERLLQTKPTIVCILGYSISYGLFGIALLGIDLGIAYATWSSVGIIATSCVGYLYYKQKLMKIGYISLLVIMISTITLNLLG